MKSVSFSRRHGVLLFGAVIAVIAVVGFYVLAKHGIGLPCLFYQITGLSCPGCGNSRAALALLRLDVMAALRYNLLFPLEVLYIAWVVFHCCRAYLKGKRFSYRPPYPWVDITVLVLVLLWWPLRNLI